MAARDDWPGHSRSMCYSGLAFGSVQALADAAARVGAPCEPGTLTGKCSAGRCGVAAIFPAGLSGNWAAPAVAQPVFSQPYSNPCVLHAVGQNMCCLSECGTLGQRQSHFVHVCRMMQSVRCIERRLERWFWCGCASTPILTPRTLQDMEESASACHVAN